MVEEVGKIDRHHKTALGESRTEATASEWKTASVRERRRERGEYRSVALL